MNNPTTAAATDPKAQNQAPAQALARVLIVDDEAPLLRAFNKITTELGYEVETFEHPDEALARAQGVGFDVALLDIQMNGMTGLELLKHLKTIQPELEVIMMTGHGTVADAFQAVRLGAFNFLRKPFENAKQELRLALEQAVERRRLRDRNRLLESKLGAEDGVEAIIGRAPAMRPVLELVAMAAPSQSTILVLGETGVGKDLVARAIHARSRRSHRPLVALNCGAVNEDLVEAELFGSKVGAFTGAVARPGLFATADGSTLFLDEIGDMSLTNQTKLLRVLESGEIKALGSDEVRKVDVRVLAATNVDLDKAVTEGRFRADLLSRLRVFRIKIPPLRERLEDVPLIAYSFLKHYAAREQKTITSISPELIELMLEYSWPENVRDLRNVVESAVVMCQTDELTIADCRMSSLGDVIRRHLPTPQRRASGAPSDPALFQMPFAPAKSQAVTAFEREYMVKVLEACGHNLTRAAGVAGMDRANLRRVLKRCGLRETDDDSADG